MSKITLGMVTLLAISFSQAEAVLITVGDNDGYGVGQADNSSFVFGPVPTDNRSVAEMAAINGAQQSDFFSAVFNPLPMIADVLFPLPDDMISATLTIDMYGFDASTFGEIAASYNGVLQPGLLNFDDGAQQSIVRQFVLDATAIANANSDGEFRLQLDRSNSDDAIGFDYFELDAELRDIPPPVIPEPGTLAIWSLLGMVGLARGRRFR